MTKEEWEELFQSFESSGLTQKAFCLKRGIEHRHFLYRWNSRREKKNKNSSSNFEAVSVLSPFTVENNKSTLKIYLPNEILCEITMSFNDMQRWIKGLADVNSR